jgi:D-glycero-alpha-D-manno-heptose-7-phosphate kinase
MAVRADWLWGLCSRKVLTVKDVKKFLESNPVEASTACRIDCGGTLDIKTFYYPLRHFAPCTFNIALNMKTRVRLLPYRSGLVKVSSRGFPTEVHQAESAPFDSPLGLMFAVAAYFRVEGVHIEMVSASPPRSGLGGSSTAAVALIAALSKALNVQMSQENVVLLAHAIEEAVAGVPCGLQDQLAAAYGGVHAWYWPGGPTDPPFKRLVALTNTDYVALERRVLVAYCGIPHESRDINTKWVQHFVTGKERSLWVEIVTSTKAFVDALRARDWTGAVMAMNREVEIRRKITPEVFDEPGEALLKSALTESCGARFTGAGGGGCIWALGETAAIEKVRAAWTEILSERQDARLLDARVDPKGLEVS